MADLGQMVVNAGMLELAQKYRRTGVELIDLADRIEEQFGDEANPFETEEPTQVNADAEFEAAWQWIDDPAYPGPNQGSCKAAEEPIKVTDNLWYSPLLNAYIQVG